MNINKKKTKIVATLGPASESIEVLKKMIQNGMTVARFNFSHGEYTWHKKVMANIRSISEQLNIPVAILADLQGPRVRTIVDKEFEIKSGEIVRILDNIEVNKNLSVIEGKKAIIFDCPNIVKALKLNTEILIEDGIMKVKVLDILETHAIVEVIDGGVVKNHKGVNIPDVHIPLPTITKKDYQDLEFALGENVDFIALSFVRNSQDLVDIRKYMKKIVGQEGTIPRIISKIECREALKNLDRIISASDAIMVARGDLGIEAKASQITLLEKNIIIKSLNQLRPVIVATQMLASMEKNARPTRAEVADVTNAVIDHSDAVMLSAEASVGDYPIESVRTMAEIALETEKSEYDDVKTILPVKFFTEEVKIAQSTYLFAKEMEAQAMVIYSESGYTARLLSHFRPDCLILVATNNYKTYNQLALTWGVRSFFCELDSRKEAIDKLIVDSMEINLLQKDDLVVSVLGSTKKGKKLTLTGTRIV